MRKLTADYYFKRMVKSRSVPELFASGTQLYLYWVDHYSYQYRKLFEYNK